jgi:hypothetical protein
MNKHIDVLIKTRTSLLAGMNTLTADELNFIPDGFNNNIIWNLGHLIAAQQGICYQRAGLPMLVTEQLHAAYKPGSKPAAPAQLPEIDTIKQLLLATLDQLALDIQTGIFDNYTPWVNRFGFEINNINDALAYLPYHDGLHADRISVFKKMINA